MDGQRPGRRGVSRRAAVRGAGLAAIAAGVSVATGGIGAAAQSGAASGIVGTWRVRIPSTLVNRTAEIQYLLIFIPGGVFLTSDSPAEPPADPAGGDPVDYQGLYAGQWLQLPSGEIRVTALQLNYDRRAVVTSEEAIHYTLSYNGAADTLAGTWEWRETVPDGRVLFTSTGPVTGTRVQVEG